MTLMESLFDLDIIQNKYPTDFLLNKQLVEFRLGSSACVTLKTVLSAKSGCQVVACVFLSQLKARGTNCFLIGDLHGMTARLEVGPGACHHRILEMMRTNEREAAGSLLLLFKPVVVYDQSNECTQIYCESQMQISVCGKAKFAAKCGAKTKKGEFRGGVIVLH